MVDQVIKLKRNTANTNAPDTGDIVVGELAIGAVAGKLYMRKSDDSILTFSDDSNVSTTLTIAADSGSNDTVTVGTNTLTFNGTSNQIGTTVSDNAITIALADNPVIEGTGSIRVPDGTTGQRPGSPAAGMFRYNTTTSKFEGYTDDWGDIGGGGANTFTRNAYTGDGSTTAFTLSQTVNSENDLIVFIEGVFQDQDAYSVSGTTLTFDTAPVSGRGIIVYSVKHTVAGSNLNIDTMTGDGSDTTLSLTISPNDENNTQVFIDGVYQNKSTYSISGSTLTFSTAPPNGSAVECMTFTQTDVNEATYVTANANNSTNETVYPTFVDGATGKQEIETDTGLTYNPSTGLLTTTLLAGTLNTAAQTNITSLGTLTTLTVDDITIDGSTISDAGDFTLDVGGDISLDADGGNVYVKDAGTTIGQFFNSGNDFVIKSEINDQDLVFKGVDNSSNITALTLDMSDAGTATFNHDVLLGSSGKIGIGIAPAEMLDIQSASGDARIRLDAPASSDTEIKFFNDGSAQYTIGHDDATDNFVIGGDNVDAPLVSVNKSGDLTIPQKIIHSGDTDTYLSFANADDFRIVAGNSTRAAFNTSKIHFNQEGIDQDFHVQGDNETNLLYVDAGNDRVGIGTASPATTLHVLQDSAKIQLESNGSDTGVQLILDGARTSNGTVGDIVFENAHDTVAMIRAERVGGNDDAADMSFYTQVTGGSNAEKMRIDSSGNVGIGESSPLATLHIKQGDSGLSSLNAAAHHLFLEDTGANGPGITFASGTTSNCTLAFGDSDSNYVGFILYDNSEDAFKIGTNAGGEDMRIDSSGRVGINRTPAIANAKLEVGGADNVPLINVEASGVTGGMGVGATGLQFFHGTTSRMKVNSSGHVIAPDLNTTGSTTNRYPLYWVHTGTAGSLEPYTGSVRAMKTAIADMGSVNWIYSLTPRSFKFRDYTIDSEGNRTYLETTNDLPNTEYGLIAEEVDSVSGSDYILDKDSDDNVKGVLYHNLVPILLKSIQELEARIKTLEDA